MSDNRPTQEEFDRTFAAYHKEVDEWKRSAEADLKFTTDVNQQLSDLKLRLNNHIWELKTYKANRKWFFLSGVSTTVVFLFAVLFFVAQNDIALAKTSQILLNVIQLLE